MVEPVSPSSMIFGLPLKYVSLVVLVAQNSSLVILMRYSRTKEAMQSSTSNADSQGLYIASTAVFWMEIVKLVTCLLLLFREKKSVAKFMYSIRHDVLGNVNVLMKMLVPAVSYALQNNLLFLALTNLDAATFQVIYQLKILTTAIFSALLLQKTISTLQWFSLCLLMLGVCLVQAPTGNSPERSSITNTDEDFPDTIDDLLVQNQDESPGRRKLAAAIRRSASEQELLNDLPGEKQNSLLGFSAVLAACLSSGFAGCYFERLLKGGNNTGYIQPSVWVRNIQLGMFGAFFSLLTMMLSDGTAISQNGLFSGYNYITWLVIFNQAIGGLVVALAVKYADNILKSFATSISVIVSGMLSYLFFDFQPTYKFVSGATLVVVAVCIYSRAEVYKGERSNKP